MPIKGDKIPVRDRIVRMVRIEGDHWIWQGYCGKPGKDTPAIKGGKNETTTSARGIVYEEFVGPKPEWAFGFVANCGTYACVAPDHLQPISRDDLVARRVASGAHRHPHGPYDGAVENPCAGHECDNCAICQRGRCCRNDHAEYQLPEEGSWGQPIYGELGVLEQDASGRAVCHICGSSYGNLFNHVWHTHNITADEYRALFGLNRKHGLTGDATRAKNTSPENLARLAQARPEVSALRNLTLEQRKATAKRPWRKEARDHVEEARAVEKAFRDLGSVMFRQRKKGPRGDGSGRKPLRGKVISCQICGNDVYLEPALARKGARTTCGKESCVLERQRRRMLADPISKRPEVRRKIAAKSARRKLLHNEKGRIVGWDPEASG